MTKKVILFSSKPYEKNFFDQVNKEFNFEIYYVEEKLNKNTMFICKNYDAVCVFVHDIIDKEVLKFLFENNIKIVALRSAGYNNVDLKSAYEYKIHIVRVPKYSPYSVAEHTIGLILALNRKIHKAYLRTKELNFDINGFLGFDLYGKTAGVIGTGNIGKIVAKILSLGFGLKVLCYDVKPDFEFAKSVGVEYTDLDTLFRNSDIITLHCPLTKETIYLLNEESFKKMKDGVMIINTSRGLLINTKDLINNLKKGKIGYAGLDVYEEEDEYFFEDFSTKGIPDDTLARLLTFPNVLITSHQAFFTKEALQNIACTTLKNIDDYFKGKNLENEVCYFCGQDRSNCNKITQGRCF